MTMYYAPYLDVQLAGLGSITLSRSGGYSDVVVNMSSGVSAADYDAATSYIFSHAGPANIRSETADGSQRLRSYSRTTYGAALQAALRDAATAASWPSPTSIQVTNSNASGAYTISYTTTFSIAWSSANGRAFLGFTADKSGSSSYAGTITPTYLVIATLDDSSDDTPNYEPEAIGNRVIADDGSGYGLTRSIAPLYRDWVQQFETKEKTLRRSAASTHPWTFQHLFEHCRGEYAFVIYIPTGSNGRLELFSLRSDGLMWKPERASPGNDAQFHIPFRCIVEGTGV